MMLTVELSAFLEERERERERERDTKVSKSVTKAVSVDLNSVAIINQHKHAFTVVI